MRNVCGMAALALLFACGGGKAARPGGALETTPSWLAEGSGAIKADGGKRLQGVGVASGAAHPQQRRRAADEAAREQLQTGVDALAQALAKLSESKQADVGETVKTLARRAASQVAGIRDHWVTPDGDERALAVVDLDAFRRALQGVEGDEKIKGEMMTNAERAFEQIAAR
jgi:hypothetical protein